MDELQGLFKNNPQATNLRDKLRLALAYGVVLACPPHIPLEHYITLQRVGRKEKMIDLNPYASVTAEEEWKTMALHLLQRISQLERQAQAVPQAAVLTEARPRSPSQPLSQDESQSESPKQESQSSMDEQSQRTIRPEEARLGEQIVLEVSSLD